MTKFKLITGQLSTSLLLYQTIDLKDCVGKTIEGIGQTKVQGEYGPEPCVVLLFTDGTKHGFVLPTE